MELRFLRCCLDVSRRVARMERSEMRISLPDFAGTGKHHGIAIESGGLRLRPHPRHFRRTRADRGLRRHRRQSGAGGGLSPRLQVSGIRHQRNFHEQLHHDDRARRCALRRRAGLRLAAVPAQRHLYPHRPRHRQAGRPQGQDHRPAGVSDHRECLDPRHPAGRIRRAAERHQMAARRHRGAGPRGARADQAARTTSTSSRFPSIARCRRCSPPASSTG